LSALAKGNFELSARFHAVFSVHRFGFSLLVDSGF
jgi:hypothetical protein